ncbi:hypothetical protein HK101_002364, partial [Irineochytrium annulatum]
MSEAAPGNFFSLLGQIKDRRRAEKDQAVAVAVDLPDPDTNENDHSRDVIRFDSVFADDDLGDGVENENVGGYTGSWETVSLPMLSTGKRKRVPNAVLPQKPRRYHDLPAEENESGQPKALKRFRHSAPLDLEASPEPVATPPPTTVAFKRSRASSPRPSFRHRYIGPPLNHLSPRTPLHPWLPGDGVGVHPHPPRSLDAEIRLLAAYLTPTTEEAGVRSRVFRRYSGLIRGRLPR